ncbi:MAG TPA: imidazolonepropionase [Pyrinomonadaceae bacterium]|nr:imidazolonepropionase [Pyrinomonadaceae bacterium]
MDADLIIHNAGQLLTCASGDKPKRGADMLDVGIIVDGAVAMSGGKVVGVGSSMDVLRQFVASEMVDAGGNVVMPGFVDPHTHIVFAGDRLDEFELKIKGAEYLDILAAGGGINSTVKATRAASIEQLVALGRKQLDKMVACGTTTCEIKTGYGLDTDTELKMLAVIEQLDKTHPMTIVPTFLAAHAVPPEYNGNSEKYVNLICDTMLSAAWKWFVASSFYGKAPFFCDVFCEKGAFALQQTKKILETAKSLGFKLKAHVDQFTNLGGSRLAIDMRATSIDHLDAISDEEIGLLAASDTVGAVIPTENFSGGKTEFANARKLIDQGCAVAVSTDFNPGSAPCPSQPMAMAIAARYQKLQPAECVNATTINAAHAIGMGAKVGSIEIGKQADIVILDTADYRQVVQEFGGNLVTHAFSKGVQIV